MTARGDRELAEVLERTRGDEGVLGALLFGSRAWGQAVDDHSDHDLLVVTVDREARKRFEHEFPFVRGEPLEVICDTLEGLRAHAAVGSESEWARPAYLHARVLLDRTGGELERIVAEKLRVPADTRLERARRSLDAYVNSYHRSARNRMVGLDTAARLDAAESIALFLTAIFTLESRVRPFNKHLEWELRERPLGDGAWSADRLLPRLDRIVGGSLADQQALFREVERVARAAGLGDVIDSWEPDVAWLRGEAEYHAPR
jgi:predicted nucleotidyltransferase